jgi:hypothetical protein
VRGFAAGETIARGLLTSYPRRLAMRKSRRRSLSDEQGLAWSCWSSARPSTVSASAQYAASIHVACCHEGAGLVEIPHLRTASGAWSRVSLTAAPEQWEEEMGSAEQVV